MTSTAVIIEQAQKLVKWKDCKVSYLEDFQGFTVELTKQLQDSGLANETPSLQFQCPSNNTIFSSIFSQILKFQGYA